MILLILMLVLVFFGALAVLLFLKTKRVFIPTVTLMILSFFETPIKHILWILGVEGIFLDHMLTSLRNTLYRRAYAQTPYETRAIFLPQCLRHTDCPAKLTSEGIVCVNCGRCGIGELKKFSEDLGYLFFVVPGSSFIKCMIRKYRPKAVLGVGCSMEVKEGTALMSSIGMPVQSVTLLRDGCVDTRVDVMALVEKIVSSNHLEFSSEHKRLADRIASKWEQCVLASPEDKQSARQRYLGVEEDILKVKRRLW